MWKLLILALILIVPFSYGGTIEAHYNKYGWNNASNTFTARDGLRYSFDSEGIVKVYELDNRLVSSYIIGVEADISGVNYVSTANEFTWTWTTSNFTEIDERTNLTYVKQRIQGYNNYAPFVWVQTYDFYPHKDVKITNTFVNNLVQLDYFKIWYILPLESTDRLMYNNEIFSPRFNNTISVEGVFNNIIPRVDFLGGSTFDWSDALEEYTVSHIIYGNGSFFNYDNDLVFAVAFDKGRSFFFGETFILDPTSTAYKVASTYNTGGWTNPGYVSSSDDNYATTSTLYDTINMTVFSFGLPVLSSVTGIEVTSEGRGGNSPCLLGEGQQEQFKFSYDGGLNWSDTKTASTFRCLGIFTFDDTSTDGGSADLWGVPPDFPGGPSLDSDKFNDSNFILTMNFSKIVRSGVPNPGMDYVAVRIWYNQDNPDVNFTGSTPEDGDTVSASIRINVTSNQALENATFFSNHSGTIEGYSMTEIDSNNWTYSGIGLEGADDGISYVFYAEGCSAFNCSLTPNRTVTVSSNLPSVNLESPLNNSYNISDFRLLNWSVLDTEQDGVDTFLYVRYDNDTFSEGTLYDIEYDIPSGNKSSFNVSSVPYDPYLMYASYKFDKRTSFGENDSHVFDWSENGLNGTLSASPHAPVFVGGKFLWGYAFDGSSDNILIGNSSQFSNLCENNQCSISAWIGTTQTIAKTVLSRKNGSSVDNYFTMSSSKSSLYFSIGNGSTITCSGASFPPALGNNEWGLDTVTYNGTEVCMYRNGVLKECDTCNYPNAVTLETWQDNNINTYIGGYGPGGTLGEWNGQLDEIGLWNRTLTAEEVAGLYSLRNGSHYWSVRSYEAPNNFNTSQWVFNVGEADSGPVCSYTCSDQIISTSLDCSGQDLELSGAATIEFQNTVVADSLSVINGCFASFLSSVDVLT